MIEANPISLLGCSFIYGMLIWIIMTIQFKRNQELTASELRHMFVHYFVATSMIGLSVAMAFFYGVTEKLFNNAIGKITFFEWLSLMVPTLTCSLTMCLMMLLSLITAQHRYANDVVAALKEAFYLDWIWRLLKDRRIGRQDP